MFCQKCGAAMEDNAQVCPSCGAPVTPAEAPQAQNSLANQTPEIGMGWYKFLIYFGLFAGAILNVVNAINIFSSMEDFGVQIVYEIFEGAKIVDFILIGALVVLAALGVYARTRLAGFHKNGPTMLNYTYLWAAAIQLLYIIAVNVVYPEGLTEYIDFSPNISNMCISVAMVFINTNYFKKRSHLFVND